MPVGFLWINWLYFVYTCRKRFQDLVPAWPELQPDHLGGGQHPGPGAGRSLRPGDWRQPDRAECLRGPGGVIPVPDSHPGMVTSELSIMTTLILAGKQRGDPQCEDCPGHWHSGEPGAVQWIIFPLQSAQFCCSLFFIFFMLFLVDQPTKLKRTKTVFINNPTFLMKVCLYFYLYLSLSLCIHSCILNKRQRYLIKVVWSLTFISL